MRVPTVHILGSSRYCPFIAVVCHSNRCGVVSYCGFSFCFNQRIKLLSYLGRVREAGWIGSPGILDSSHAFYPRRPEPSEHHLSFLGFFFFFWCLLLFRNFLPYEFNLLRNPFSHFSLQLWYGCVSIQIHPKFHHFLPSDIWVLGFPLQSCVH